MRESVTMQNLCLHFNDDFNLNWLAWPFPSINSFCTYKAQLSIMSLHRPTVSVWKDELPSSVAPTQQTWKPTVCLSLYVIYGTQVKERHVINACGCTYLKDAETCWSKFSGSAKGIDSYKTVSSLSLNRELKDMQHIFLQAEPWMPARCNIHTA